MLEYIGQKQEAESLTIDQNFVKLQCPRRLADRLTDKQKHAWGEFPLSMAMGGLL